MENSRPGKRKSAGQDIIFEISDEDISSPEHIDDSSEPFAKVSKTDSGNEPKNNLQIGKEISLVLDNLMEKNREQEAKEQGANKEDKKQEAKEEDKNEEGNMQEVASPPALEDISILSTESRLEEGEVNDDECLGQNESDNTPSIIIQFRDNDTADLYKFKFLKFIQSFVELDTFESDRLTIQIQRDNMLNPKEWVVLDETLCADVNTEVPNNDVELKLTPPNNKQKKKNKKHKEPELFTLDTTPSQDPYSKQSMKYASKFQIDVTEKTEETNERSASLSMCFNCEGSHSLRECPEPPRLC